MMILNPPDEQVLPLYKSGELLLWDNLLLTYLDDLRAFNVHKIAKWKKLKSKDALVPIVGGMKSHPLSVWTLNPDAAVLMQRILRITENEVRHCIRTRWFPNELLDEEVHSWRYTLTRDEPLHFDVYADRVKDTVIRIFVNLDDEPRVWELGPIAKSDEDGVWDPVYKARVLKHVETERIEFPPGAVWAVDSRRVSHAILYGKRAAMFSWRMKNES